MNNKSILRNYILSLYISASIVVIFTLLSPEKFLHWFIFPVFFCGVIIGADALKWFRGYVDLFDPIGIIGLYGFYLFFITPLLHTYFDYWLLYLPKTKVTFPQDWRDWVGLMSFLNLFGLIGYKIIVNSSYNFAKINNKLLVFNMRIFWPLLLLSLFVTLCLQVMIYFKFGGLLNYVMIYEEIGPQAFRGWGIWFSISESFPVLLFMSFIVLAKKIRFLQNSFIIGLTLFVFFILKIPFGGLRGSRSEIITAMFWALGAIHLALRPISRKVFYVVIIFSLILIYFYGFYKSAGTKALSILTGKITLFDLEQISRRDEFFILFVDLSRTDLYAYLLYRLIEVKDYEYAWGRTYLGALCLLIPRSIWPNRPPTKVKEGTEAQFGMGSYVPGVFESSRTYGLAGEIMLNFGPFAIPFGFMLWGILVKYIRCLINHLHVNDARRLLAPWLVIFCVAILHGDSDNLLFFFFKRIFIPSLIIWTTTKELKMEYEHSSHS